MTTKSVIICEYCKERITEDQTSVHDLERRGNEITHEGNYHQECFINSIIKDLEELGFEIIRPKSEISGHTHPENYLDLANPELMKTGLNLLSGLIPKPSPEDLKNYQEKKEKAFEDLKKSETKTHDGKKREAQKKTAPQRKNKISCENCGLSNGYPRLKTNEWICISCGHVTPIKQEAKK